MQKSLQGILKNGYSICIWILKEIRNTTLYDVANNGREAIYKIENSTKPPDIIFMDINMPLMDGINCLKVLKQKPEIKNIPVILLTSDAAKAEVALELGAEEFIEKPNDGKSLRNKIEQILYRVFQCAIIIQ